MDFRAGIGSLACRLCGASYQMPIHHLHEPVDVFSEWLDDCEAAAQGKAPPSSTSFVGGDSSNPRGSGRMDGTSAAQRYGSEDDEDDDEELPPSSGIGSKSKQPPDASTATAKSSSSSSKTISGKKKSSNNQDKVSSRTSYTDLGLDDSDDDSDD